MRALLLDEARELSFAELESPTPTSGEVLVDVRAAALNHRELWISKGMYPNLTLPATLGADGAGLVVAVGEGVDETWLGREVVCYPALGWGSNSAAPGRSFRLFGMPEPGFIADQICVPVGNLVRKPAHLDWVGAAALPVASLTAWRALVRHAGVRAGQKVLVTGIGGGVAQAALAFASAMGAQVYVSSSSEEKLQQAVTLGATAGVNYRQTDWPEELRKLSAGIDVVIDGAPPKDFKTYMHFLKPGAKVVIYGATGNNSSSFSCSDLFLRHISVIGTSMGTVEEFRQMIDYVEAHRIFPVVAKVFAFDQAIEAVGELASGSHVGKIVIERSGR